MQQVTRKTLGAGVNLTCVTTPKFKRAVLRAALLLPLGGPDAALRACLPQVLRRGTMSLGDLRAIGQSLDELFGARIEAIVRKEGETLVIGFISDCIDEAYTPGADRVTAKVIRLLADLLYDPCLQDGVFRADYVAGERDNLIDRIAALKNDPRAQAPRRMNELMCEKEAYGQSALGTAEQAQKITENKLYTAYRRALEEAQIELFYCGTLAPDAVEALFADTPLVRREEKAFYMPRVEIIAQPAGEVREIIEEEQVTQGKLSLGFRTGGNCLRGGDPIAYWMFQTIYGGCTSSKLFLNVREKKSLCYYASAQFIGLKGIMQVNSGIENKNYEVARDEILHQLQLCQQGEVTAQEMEAARGTLANAWRGMLDDPLTLERYWLVQAVAGTLVSPEDRIRQLADVTREQVVAAAQATAVDTIYYMKGAAK